MLKHSSYTPPSEKKRVAVFISGRGSNMVALAKAATAMDYPAYIAVIFSDQPKAKGLKLAQQLKLPYFALEACKFPNKQAYEKAILHGLADYKIDIIALAGYKRILSEEFIAHFPQGILNIHPSLLPSYPGLQAISRALKAGEQFLGVTVHLVNKEVDAGTILAQKTITVLPEDSETVIKEKLLSLEHRLYSQTLKNYILNYKK